MPKNIVVIGGGTGTYVVLKGLKEYPVNLSAIVSMTDSGGSTGRLRDQLGVLPPGDLRQALVALSSSEKIWRDLFLYRFNNGDLNGHNFGNIFLSALEKITGSIEQSIELASRILGVRGYVCPVTLQKADLCVELADGQIIEGEKHIDYLDNIDERAPIKKAYLSPFAKANPTALSVMEKADLIVLGPGDLYTSIIPNLLVEGVSSSIKKSGARKVFIMNLMTKYGQTTDYKASDHIRDLEKYIGENALDYIVINSRKPSNTTLDWYHKYNEAIVEDDISELGLCKIIREDVLMQAIIGKDEADAVRRSIIRHDSAKLARVLYSIF